MYKDLKTVVSLSNWTKNECLHFPNLVYFDIETLISLLPVNQQSLRILRIICLTKIYFCQSHYRRKSSMWCTSVLSFSSFHSGWIRDFSTDILTLVGSQWLLYTASLEYGPKSRVGSQWLLYTASLEYWPKSSDNHFCSQLFS